MTGTEPAVTAETAETAPPRGELHINRAVLRKIAERTADLHPDSARKPRRVAGIATGGRGAEARLTGPDDAVRVRLDVALRYPAEAETAARGIREQVTEELRRLADCRVRRVDVAVSALVPQRRKPEVD